MDDETFAWCLFSEADTDESGSLDREEIRALARNLGHSMSDAEVSDPPPALPVSACRQVGRLRRGQPGQCPYLGKARGAGTPADSRLCGL